MDLVRKAFPDVSSDSSVCAMEELPAQRTTKELAIISWRDCLTSHWARIGNFSVLLMVRFFRGVFFRESTRDYTVLMWRTLPGINLHYAH